MASGEDPLLKFMGDKKNEKKPRTEEDEIPAESTH